jgi:tripartite-type tricarboxylate transporter receptor subunit TctC
VNQFSCAALVIASITAMSLATAAEQAFPVKPLRILTGDPGGGIDFTARMIALGLPATLGQQVVVDNRGGGGGILAGETLAKAPADGYTLLVYSNNIWILPFLRTNVSYDPARDFSTVTLVSRAPNILVVNPSVPAKDVRELIALAKAKPGELNYAQGATGGSNHLGAELFKAMAGVNIVEVPYKGVTPAFNDLISGRVQLMFAIAASVSPHVKSGKLRALAVTSAQPSPLALGLPTVAASGVPGYESEALFGVFAPARTPKALIERLNREIVQLVTRPDTKEKFFVAGAEVIGSTAEEFAAVRKSDMSRWARVIKDAGIKAD